jgi:hypothetical protein
MVTRDGSVRRTRIDVTNSIDLWYSSAGVRTEKGWYQGSVGMPADCARPRGEKLGH